MPSLSSLLQLVHLIGLSLAVGSATAKLVLLFRCKRDTAFVTVYLKAVKPITRLIVFGMLLLTLSGVGWLLLGYELTSLLVAKVILVAAVWVLGPIIDNIVEPKFQRYAPSAIESASPEFFKIQERYLMLEVTATGLFYVIIFIWILL